MLDAQIVSCVGGMDISVGLAALPGFVCINDG